jgi:hypothetical protein
VAKLAKRSLSIMPTSCAAHVRRLSAWGIPMDLGLRGGAGGETSVANGTTGWGPPPAGAAAATNSGWGAPPPGPNPVASAAWGAPIPAQQGNKNPNGKYAIYYIFIKQIVNRGRRFGARGSGFFMSVRGEAEADME